MDPFKREKIFIQAYLQDKKFIHQPPPITMSNGQKYRPDFYLPETKTYIEVVGQSSAFYFNRNKYAQFMKDGYYLEIFDFRGFKFKGKIPSSKNFIPMARTIVETDEQTKDALKALAFHEDKTMKELIDEAIKLLIDTYSKEGKKHDPKRKV